MSVRPSVFWFAGGVFLGMEKGHPVRGHTFLEFPSVYVGCGRFSFDWVVLVGCVFVVGGLDSFWFLIF